MIAIVSIVDKSYPREKNREPNLFENAFNSIDRELRNEDGLASELDYAEQTSGTPLRPIVALELPWALDP